MLCTKIVLNIETKQKQQFVYATCSAGILSLQFSWPMNNLLSYCGLVDAKIRASDKDLPVTLLCTVSHHSNVRTVYRFTRISRSYRCFFRNFGYTSLVLTQVFSQCFSLKKGYFVTKSCNFEVIFWRTSLKLNLMILYMS